MKHPLIFLLPLALFGPARLLAQLPELVTVKDGHIGPVRTACYTPGERQALTGGTDRRVVLWDLDAAKYVRHVETPEVPLQLAFTGNGRGAVVLMYDRLQHWDLESGSLLREHRLPEFHDHFIRTDTLWLEKEGKPTGIWVILQDSLRSIPPQGRNLPQQPTFNPDDYPGLAARIAAFSLEDNVQWKHIPSRKLVLLYGGKPPDTGW